MNSLNDLVPFTPQWQFLRDQEEAALSVGLNPDLQDCFSEQEHIKQLLSLSGTTELVRRNCLFRVRQQTIAYSKFFCEVKDKLYADAQEILNRSEWKLPNDALDTLDQLRFTDYKTYQDFEYEIRQIKNDDDAMLEHDKEVLFDRLQQLENHMDYIQTVSQHLVTTNTIGKDIKTGYKVPIRKGSSRLKDEYLSSEWRKYVEEFPKRELRLAFGIPENENFGYDEAAMMLVKGQMLKRRSEHVQRLKNETIQRTADGWYLIFDTLTFSNEGLAQFVNDPDRTEVIKYYLKKIGWGVNAALGRDPYSSYTDVYKYYAVYEHGTQKGRFHYHIMHYCKELPFDCQDPFFGVPEWAINEDTAKIKQWPKFKYGRNYPLAVRYNNDPFTKKQGWLAPRDKDGKVRPNSPVEAVIGYVAKYVLKDVDRRIGIKEVENEIKLKGEEEWNKTLRRLDLKQSWCEAEFRTRMSRGFGMTLPSMEHLSSEALEQLKNLHWKVCALNSLLKKKVQEEAALRAGMLTFNDTQGNLPPVINQLKYLRLLMNETVDCNSLSSGSITTPKLTEMDISDEVKDYLRLLAVQPKTDRIQNGGSSK